MMMKKKITKWSFQPALWLSSAEEERKGKLLLKNEETSRGKAHTNRQKLI